MSDIIVRDHFGTIIELGDIVIYPASGEMLEAKVIEIGNTRTIRTQSESGTRKWKNTNAVFAKEKTLKALRKMYPEDHI